MRSQSRASVTDDTSENVQMELELARLQRSYRVMQNDYRAYKEQTKRSVNKQTLLIEELQKEREEIDTMLSNMETTQNKCKDEQNARKLRELSHSEKEHQTLIEEERQNIKYLDSQILDMERRIAAQRKKMGGIHNSTNKHIATEKRRAVLENRLDKAVVYFNRQLAINSKLREDIDHYRRERSVFEGLYKRLAKELDQTKTDIAEVIRSSTQAFEQRDEAKGKMNALKERTDKDQKQHNAEMKELQRVIGHDNKMKEFMHIKSNDRVYYKTEEAAKKKRNERHLDADHIFMQSYEQALDRIKEVTGLQTIEEIVENFVTNEDENFALFNYVNELNCEEELLQDEVAQVSEHIKKFKDQDKEFTKQHNQLMSEMEQKYLKLCDDSTKKENRLKEVNKTMDHLRHGIEKLFGLMDCNTAPLLAMLGSDSGISNKNVMVYLGQIEHKTMQLLHFLQFMQQKHQELEGIILEKVEKAIPLKSVASLHVSPPCCDDIDSGSEMEDDLKPLTQDELRERIAKEIDRKTMTEIHREHPTAKNGEPNKTKDASKKKKEVRS